MNATMSIEEQRVVLQNNLDTIKTQAERNRLGQFATPTELASEMLSYARRLMPANSSIRFLDPAIGTGSFYSALLREFPSERIEAANGFEIDPHYGEPARALWNDPRLKLTLGDFTMSAQPKDGGVSNLVICNPPYVRHHHLDKAAKERLLHATIASSGMKLDGLAGLYCYFIGLAHAWMETDAIAGWLIPSEFMDVKYGVSVKRYLLNEVELLRVHRFDPSELQFGDALVSSAVVWFRKRRPTAAHKVEFSYGGTLTKPAISRMVYLNDLKDSAKWTGIATSGVRAVIAGPRLADFFTIKRGIATGDNGFFIMSRDEIVSRDLPMEFFRPILPGPRHLETDIVESNADGTPKLVKQLFMLDCRIPETQLKDRYPTLWAYYQSGKPKVSETYLCSHRNPWYAQEKRPPALFICTYMGRNLAKRDKPFRFILNRSQATAANVYLLLYPNVELTNAIANNPELALRIWEFLNGIDSSTLLCEGRVYGGGLYKLEPKELANVPAQAIVDMLPIPANRDAKQCELFVQETTC